MDKVYSLMKPDPVGSAELEKVLVNRGVPFKSVSMFLRVRDLKEIPEHYRPALLNPWCVLDLDKMTNDVLSLIKDIPVTHLLLNQSSCADLNAVKDMPLVMLSLHASQTSDLSPLKGMKLFSVDIRASKVTDLTPLEGMPLDELDLTGTKVSDIDPILHIPSLEVLSLSLSAVTDITVVAKSRVRCLYLPETVTGGLDLLRQNKSIKYLGYEESDVLPVEKFWKKVDSGAIKIKK